MYSVEAGSADLHLPSEEGNNQLGESAKESSSNNCKYLTELMLDGIINPDGGNQENTYLLANRFTEFREAGVRITNTCPLQIQTTTKEVSRTAFQAA